MATLYGANATKIQNQTIKQLIGPGEQHARKRICYDSYTLTAALSQNDVIKLMKLPPGALVHDVIVAFSASLDASGGTLDIGWQANSSDVADTDGFMDAIDVTTSGGGVFIMCDDKPQRPGIFKRFDYAGGETQVVATVTHSGGLDATSGTLHVCVEYSID